MDYDRVINLYLTYPDGSELNRECNIYIRMSLPKSI